MSGNNNLHFSKVKIEGYRGRHFELNMKPRGEHSVFIMDGNTGKTTTIELLRWCFTYKESDAEGKFRHMWQNPAHILDSKVEGKQKCNITINFSDDNHDYSFRRETKGEYKKERDQNKKVIGDVIESIDDYLEIDNGKDVIQGDDVNRYISRKFRLNQCAEYFCFDGEKAREVMMYSADQGQLFKLLETINQRSTHPLLIDFKSQLEKLRKKVYRVSKSKCSDKALSQNINKLEDKNLELSIARREIESIDEDIGVHEKAIFELDQDIKLLDEEISNSKSEQLLKKTGLKNDLVNIKKEIASKRSNIYKYSLNWVDVGISDIINSIKENVKERGRLPEPYRDELINMCLNSQPPTCQICGRELDEKGRDRVCELKELVAPHDVHSFLNNQFVSNYNSFDPFTINQEIQGLINQHESHIKDLTSIKLSDSEEKMVIERERFKEKRKNIEKDRTRLQLDRETITEEISYIEKEISELSGKNVALEENKIILDKIEETMVTIGKTEEKMKEKAIHIISQVISESVKSILGDNFGAKLSKEDGLLLGEDDYYDVEAGGMSGRLVLTYCFAEAMTLIDPIIVDTPSGNIGSHREALAKHLKANHDQVILLCLPTEVQNFAHVLSDEKDMIIVENNPGGG